MDEKKSRVRRVGAIALGLVLVGASILWTLFWLFGLAWVWPPELDGAVALGVLFALGIIAGVGGVVLVAGVRLSRRAWLVVGAVAVVPLAALAIVGAQTSRHASEVDELAAAALRDHIGDSSSTTTCVWEDDQDGSELWRCDTSSSRGFDRCFVWIVARAGVEAATVDRCERDAEVVARRVSERYRARRGIAKVARFCSRESDDAGSAEVWRCDLMTAQDDGYCWATVAWKGGGRMTVAIRQCEREFSAAVAAVYRHRSDRLAERARCTEDEQDDGEWICALLPSADDSCIVEFDPAGGAIGPRIWYCEQEVVARVEAAFARTYAKRTSFDDVSAACVLREHEHWNCTITLPSGRDECDVEIDMRSQGPKVDRVFTACRSGRV